MVHAAERPERLSVHACHVSAFRFVGVGATSLNAAVGVVGADVLAGLLNPDEAGEGERAATMAS
jgi:hypothetical protein